MMRLRRPHHGWTVLLVSALLAGTATAVGLSASRPGNADAWLAVLVFLTSALTAATIAFVPAATSPASTGRSQRHHSNVGRSHGRVQIPDQLPVRLRQFRGRQADLHVLLAEYDRQVRGSARRPGLGRIWPRGRLALWLPASVRTGPAVLLIEGMPGVGKTALAQELAHRMAAKFPDGQLYANLGFVGGRRAPADVLHDFLKALGVADSELPDDTAERVNFFRSLTASRRLLVVLDAARGSDQIRHLLPTGERCAVIITSRSSNTPDLGAFRYSLNPPNTTDALDILAAFSLSDPIESAAAATEIVDYAGALPLSLRSAGEQIADGRFTMRTLAKELKNRENRLSAFRYRARDIGERIDSEYKRLSSEEQRALRLLSTVESPTFGPWVLAPLMDIGENDAERLTTRLASHHLVRDSGQAAVSGLARYSLHPLVWLAARNRLRTDESPEELREARKRLYTAYLGAATAVLAASEPGLADTGRWQSPPQWARFKEVWVPAVLATLDHWVRAEYCTLVRTVRFAHDQGAWGVCWRIAARLGACVTGELLPDESISAFDAACSAAERESAPLGRIEVLLARGSFLIAVERYAEAFDDLRDVLEAVDAALPELGQPQAHRLWASAHRRKAEAWLQLGAYASARDELEIALSAAQEFAGDPEMSHEKTRISLLVAENDTWREPSRWLDHGTYEDARANSADDSLRFQAVLGLAEQARRAQEWHNAYAYLREGYAQNYGDERRIAAVQYRTARLLLHQGRNGTAAEQRNFGRMAVGYASDAVRIFHKMTNPVGAIRAEALLVRALLLADHKSAACELAGQLQGKLASLGGSDPACAALQARVWRCSGEIFVDNEDYNRAIALLSQAIDLYKSEDDWRSASDTMMSLATARAFDGQVDMALAILNEAAVSYMRSGDLNAQDDVARKRAEIVHGTGARPFRVPPQAAA
jgi:NB-ARC domain